MAPPPGGGFQGAGVEIPPLEGIHGKGKGVGVDLVLGAETSLLACALELLLFSPSALRDTEWWG